MPLAASTYWLYLMISAWAVVGSAAFASFFALSSPHAASASVTARTADMRKGRDISIFISCCGCYEGTDDMPAHCLTRYKVIQSCHKSFQPATSCE
ncbi:hypothetical protein D9M70_633100 [compost metagenome]